MTHPDRFKRKYPTRPGIFLRWGGGIGLACLLTLSFLVCVGEVCKSLSANDLKSSLRIARFDPFDEENWYDLGRIYYFSADYQKAERAFRRALGVNPLYYPAWVDLMWLSWKRSNESLPDEYFISKINFLNPTDLETRWSILLKALTIDQMQAKDIALRQVKVLLHLSQTDDTRLFRLAGMLLGDEGELLIFVPKERRIMDNLLKYYLFKDHRSDLAYATWQNMTERGWTNNETFRIMIKGLFSNKSYKKAWELWRKHFFHFYDPANNDVFNGGFERDILDYGFSWRLHLKARGLKKVKLIHFFKVEGRRALLAEYDGKHNPDVTDPYQYIFLIPGTYRMTAFLATKRVTGASGFFVELIGKDFRVTSREMRGDTGWKKIKIVFKIEKEGLYRLSLRRRSTQKLNKFLGGQVFLDNVSLVRVSEKEIP